MIIGKDEAGLNGRAAEVVILLCVFFHFFRGSFYTVIEYSTHGQALVVGNKTATVEIAVRINFDFDGIGDEAVVIKVFFY